MVRRVAFLAVLTGTLACHAEAGQTSGSFQVGVTIGGAKHRTATVPMSITTYTWGAAAISVRRAGFGAPLRLERSGMTYWFSARRDGSVYRVAVSAATGKIIKIVPV